MKIYYQNGIVTEQEYFNDDTGSFAIQHEIIKGQDIFFYPGDNLIQELNLELVNLSDKFVSIYFSDLKLYYKELLNLPISLLSGGQNSDIVINKEQFLNLTDQWKLYCKNIYRYLYVDDCRYLVSTVQNLLFSAEHCYIQYYRQLSQIKCLGTASDGIFIINSRETMQLLFYLETFFTKLYSVLDIMIKIICELKDPIEKFSAITKLKSNQKLWGDRKRLCINKCMGTIF